MRANKPPQNSRELAERLRGTHLWGDTLTKHIELIDAYVTLRVAEARLEGYTGTYSAIALENALIAARERWEKL